MKELIEVVGKTERRGFVPENQTYEVGFFSYVLPVVSAERKSVRVHLDVNLSSLEPNPAPTQVETKLQKLTLDKIVMLPDNGTAVFHLGKTLEETRTEAGPPPFMARIPYLNRLFRNVTLGQEERDVFLMVTTRVINNEQAESKFRGDCVEKPYKVGEIPISGNE